MKRTNTVREYGDNDKTCVVPAAAGFNISGVVVSCEYI